MDYGFVTAAYVVAAVLFILSLGGLSNQESAKRAGILNKMCIDFCSLFNIFI